MPACLRRENYHEALNLIQIAVKNFSDKNSLAYASAIDLLGLIHLDNAESEKALPYFQAALSLRERILGPDDAFIHCFQS